MISYSYAACYLDSSRIRQEMPATNTVDFARHRVENHQRSNPRKPPFIVLVILVVRASFVMLMSSFIACVFDDVFERSMSLSLVTVSLPYSPFFDIVSTVHVILNGIDFVFFFDLNQEGLYVMFDFE